MFEMNLSYLQDSSRDVCDVSESVYKAKSANFEARNSLVTECFLIGFLKNNNNKK